MQLRKRLFPKSRIERLDSIAALPVGRAFEGNFEVKRATYRFTYSPTMARIVGGKLELVGPFRVTDSKGATRTRENLKAVVVSTQGGLGTAPPRARLAGLEETGSGGQPQIATTERESRAIPIVEATDSLSFCGVLYLKLDSLDGRMLTVPADMSRVQVNARLYAIDEVARALHSTYSGLVDSLYGKEPNQRTAGIYLGELNRLLAKA